MAFYIKQTGIILDTVKLFAISTEKCLSNLTKINVRKFN